MTTPAETLIKVHSHPRSGTHFLEAFLARNFYPGMDLSSTADIWYGHWSNKQLLKGGEPHHRLFGDHRFPDLDGAAPDGPRVYIFRDVRSVVASLYRSRFYSINDPRNRNFHNYLRNNIDWHGGPGKKCVSTLNVIQHWYQHVDAWHQVSWPNLLILRYELLKLDPGSVLELIVEKFYPRTRIGRFFPKRKVIRVDDKVGIRPNSALIDSWRDLFNEEDLEFVYDNLPSKRYLYDPSELGIG